MDMIDLTQAVYHHSPNVSDWPQTATLDEVSWANHTIRVRHSKRGMWPPVVISGDGTQQEATIWVFRFYDNQWHGAGAERLRPTQFEKELMSPFNINDGWLYDPNRWGSLANRVVSEGEVVAFMVTSGDMRGGMQPGPRERSEVKLVRVWGNRMEMQAPTPTPVPAPTPSPQPPNPTGCNCPDYLPYLLDLKARLERVEAKTVSFPDYHSGPFVIPLPRILGGPQTVQDIVLKPIKSGE